MDLARIGAAGFAQPTVKGCDCLAKPWTWLRIGAAGFAQPTVEGMRLFG